MTAEQALRSGKQPDPRDWPGTEGTRRFRPGRPQAMAEHSHNLSGLVGS